MAEKEVLEVKHADETVVEPRVVEVARKWQGTEADQRFMVAIGRPQQLRVCHNRNVWRCDIKT